MHYIAATKNDKSRTLTVAPFVMEILKEMKKESAARMQSYFEKIGG